MSKKCADGGLLDAELVQQELLFGPLAFADVGHETAALFTPLEFNEVRLDFHRVGAAIPGFGGLPQTGRPPCSRTCCQSAAYSSTVQ